MVSLIQGFPVAQVVKNLPAKETRVQSLGREDPLGKGMATHSSILAWRIPRTEEPGGLQFVGSRRVGREWVTETHHSYVESNFKIRYGQTYSQNRNSLTDFRNKLCYQRESGGRDRLGAWDQHTAVYKIGNQQGPTV